jgi:hypothetical protein
MLLRRDFSIGETLCSAVRNVKTRVPLSLSRELRAVLSIVGG